MVNTTFPVMTDAEKIVVTGGTGYLGRALLERLSQRGNQVTVLSRLARLPAGLADLQLSGRTLDQ